MKKGRAVLAALAAALYGQAACGATLEELLKQKGVLSEAEYREVTGGGPVAYKQGEGFTFTSPDRKYQGSIGGFMQLRYTFTDPDHADNTPARGVQDSSKFEMSRVKLFFNGYSLTPDLTYKFQLNISQSNILSTGKEIEEAYLNYRIADWAQLRFGQDKVPFARQFLVSSANQQFVDLSHVATAFAPGYDAGLLLHGRVAGGLLTYNAGVFGGSGQGTVASGNDNAVSARIALNPLGDMRYVEADVDGTDKPLFSLGVNYYRDTVKNGSTNNLNLFSSSGWLGLGIPLMPPGAQFAGAEKLEVSTFGYDAAFKWRGLYAQAEYFTGRAEGKSSHNALRALGGYGQAGYFVLPGTVELVARYAYLDPDHDVANDHWVETTGGINWYFNRHSLKLQLDYSDIHKQGAVAFNGGPRATDDSRVRFQAQLIF